MTIRDRIFARISELEITQKEFAKRTGIPETNHWRRTIGDHAERICEKDRHSGDEPLETNHGDEPLETNHGDEPGDEPWRRTIGDEPWRRTIETNH